MIYRFGDCELDRDSRSLRRAGREQTVQPKVLDLLLFLVENRARAVGREVLQEALWPDTTVSDASLARLVKEARKAVGDDGRRQALIKTLYGRGLRFVADVEQSGDRPPDADAYVGRPDLLDTLERRLEALVNGRGGVLLLTGEPGVGKTRTAEELAERARLRGLPVNHAWAVESGSAPAYWLWIQVWRALADELDDAALARIAGPSAADLVQLLPELGPRLPAAGTPLRLDEESARFRLFDAIRASLRRATRAGPRLLLLDDLQWADTGSLELLEFLARGSADAPFLVLATLRETELEQRPEAARCLAALRQHRSVELLAVEPLGGEEITRFVAARSGRSVAPSLLEPLLGRSAGNPLLLGEVVEQALEAGADADPEALREALAHGARAAIERRLLGLSEAVRELLRSGAAIGARFSQDLLAEVCGLEAEATEALLAEAAQARVVTPRRRALGGWRFTHDLYREVLYTDLAASSRACREVHRSVASALEASSLPLDDERLAELARHYAAALPRDAADRIAGYALRAGRRAAELHAHDDASARYEAALGALDALPRGAERDRVALLLALAEAQLHVRGLAVARDTFRRAAEQARRSDDPVGLARAALGFADRPVSDGKSDPEVVELLTWAADALPDGHPRLAVRLRARLSAEMRYEAEDTWQGLLQRAVDDARQLGDPQTLAAVLDDQSYALWSPADPERWLALNTEIAELATRVDDYGLAIAGLRGRVTGLAELGDGPALEREVEALERLAQRLRTPYPLWLAGISRAGLALMRGELERAEEQILRCGELAQQTRSPDVQLQTGAQLIHLRVEQDRAAELLAATRAQALVHPDAIVWRMALALVLARSGETEAARGEVVELAGSIGDAPRDRGWLLALSGLAEACEAVGAREVAPILADALRPYARLNAVVGSSAHFYGNVSHHLALLELACDRTDAALAALEAGEAVYARLGARSWLARAAWDRARIHAARGGATELASARACAARARAEAKILGMSWLERRAEITI